MVNIENNNFDKNRYYVPKKKTDSSKNLANKKVRNGSIRRTDSESRKRPPLKPNLKGTKPISKVVKQKSEKIEDKRKSVINKNPFKPPKPNVSSALKPSVISPAELGVSSKDVVHSELLENITNPTSKDSDDEIKSDYGMDNQSNSQISSDQTLETSNQNIEPKEERKGYADEQSDSGEEDVIEQAQTEKDEENKTEQNQVQTGEDKIPFYEDNQYEPKINKNVEFDLVVDPEFDSVHSRDPNQVNL
jgi:cobalamin biosynthesis protein CobT